jgi:hypothetical protein
MKKTITIALLVSLLTFFASCMKEDHSIRLRNDYPHQINNASAGSAQFGDVPSGSTSAYHHISTGSFNLNGTTNNGQQLTGSGTLSGKGKHKWTITISAGGQISFTEDK